MFGRLYRCAEHQLRALPPSAELARRRLLEFQKNGAVMVGNDNISALKPDQNLKGIDITEAPEESEEINSESDEEMPRPSGDPTWTASERTFGTRSRA